MYQNKNITQSSDALTIPKDSEIFFERDRDTEVGIKVSLVKADGELHPIFTYDCPKEEKKESDEESVETEEKCDKTILDDKLNQDSIQPHFYPTIFTETIERQPSQ